MDVLAGLSRPERPQTLGPGAGLWRTRAGEVSEPSPCGMDATTWTAGAFPLRGIGPREALSPGVTWPSRRDQAGLDGPSSWGTRSGAWRRVGNNLWVPTDVDATDPRQRVVEAAAVLPSYGGVTGWAALRWCGGTWFGGVNRHGELLPVPVAVSSGNRCRPREGLRVSQEVILPSELMRWGGVRVTRPLWSVSYEMRKAATDEAAIVAFEMAAFNDLVSISELSEYVESALWLRWGVARMRRVLPLLEENSWSPMEPVMRQTWQVEAGRPRPLANRPVFDLAGRFVGTPDLLDLNAGVYGLYDGALHLAGEVRHGDVAKEAAYRALGLEGVTMMAGDLSDRSPFLHRLREAYARAERRPASERRWLAGTADWWIPTFTVAQRRALSSYDQARLLRYRHAA